LRFGGYFVPLVVINLCVYAAHLCEIFSALLNEEAQEKIAIHMDGEWMFFRLTGSRF
jgi:hypothetical protein